MYLAHFRADLPAEHTIQQHSQKTANLCRQFAIPELADMMYMMGLLHDVGKYQPSFQKKVRGAHRMVEHAVCGAKVAQERYQSVVGLLLQYCICGHHTGIPDGGYETDTEGMSSLRGRIQRKTEDFSEYKKEIIIPQLDEAGISAFLLRDCGDNWDLFVDKFAFFTRYCFSCLVDADGLDTSRFYGKDMLETLPADFAVCLERVHGAQTVFTYQTKEEIYWKRLQKQVSAQKGEKADLYILNLPMGKAKTLYAMEFALERAIREKKERIIYVMPYNSTVDETAECLEDIFQGEAVMSTGEDPCGSVRGPVQIHFAQSISPIQIQDVTITRKARTTEERRATGETEMGRKSVIPYALYRTEGHISAAQANQVTDMSPEDVALLWEAILNLFEEDHSTARGKMCTRGLYIFQHDSILGNCPSHLLFEKIQIQQKTMVPRKFSDYEVTIDERMPQGVTLIKKEW